MPVGRMIGHGMGSPDKPVNDALRGVKAFTSAHRTRRVAKRACRPGPPAP